MFSGLDLRWLAGLRLNFGAEAEGELERPRKHQEHEEKSIDRARITEDAIPLMLNLDFTMHEIDNDCMEIHGQVQNGVVVLEDGVALPEGTRVTVSCDIAGVSPKPGERKRVEFPLVHSKHPGSLHLTGQRIAEILDEEDASPRR
jgi:hypothetical protein